MAQAECVSNVQDVSDCKIIDEEELGPPSKKLRQARLPFKPLDQKPQLIKSNSPQSNKKRKLSDGESPSAKPPKSHRPVTVEKVSPTPMVDHDPEVSSSSETENAPLNNLKIRVRNTLERFVRKNSQEEISSTNCIDLTEECVVETTTEEGVVETTTEEGVVETTETGDVDEDENKENLLNDEEEVEGKENVLDDKKAECSIDKEEISKCESTESNLHINDGANEEMSSTSSEKETKESSKPTQEVKDNDLISEKKPCSPKSEGKESKLKTSVQNQSGPKLNEKETLKSPNQNQNGSKLEKTPKRGIDLFLVKVSKKVSESPDSKLIPETHNQNDSKEEDDDIEMVSEEKSEKECSLDEDADDEADSTSINKNEDNGIGLVTPAKDHSNNSLMKTPGSAAATDILKTPSQTPDGSTPTSSKLTRKLSAAKLKEREEARLQREKEREEKRLQKEQERLEKEKEKEEKRKQREDEKAEKEKQKQEEKDKREKERLEKLKIKEEERKKKQEMLDAKNEERKKKEEDKKQKEEEKLKELEEKQKKEKKVKQAFVGFFIPKTSPVSKPSKETSGLFMPFEPKADMVLAPTYRRDELQEDEKDYIDRSIKDQTNTNLYLQELKDGKICPKKSEKTLPKLLAADNDVILVHDKETIKKVTYRCKLLQFRENYRPPYYGTWRKKSKVLTAKNPFKQDSDLFDYEVESDDEWEEEEPGESLSASEGEDEKEEGADEDDEDGWMVPHGYLSDDEGCEKDEEVTAESKSARQMAKEQAWEAELKRQACRLTPVIIGCLWEQAVHSLQGKVEEALQKYKAVSLMDGPVPTSYSRVRGNMIQDQMERPSSATPKGAQKKPVPEEAMPDLIRMVHGNLAGIKKLVKEFRTFWDMKTGEKPQENPDADISMEVETIDEGTKTEEVKEESSNEKLADTSVSENSSDNCSISKRQLEMKISKIAMREKRDGFKKVCWYVQDNLLKQYSLQDLPVPSTWEFITKPFKTPNKQKAEESPVTPVGRKTPTVSITQFARPMSPSTIAAQNAAVMANLKQQQLAKQAEAKIEKETEVKMEIDTDVKEIRIIPCDQRTIMQFAKKKMTPSQESTSLQAGMPKLTGLLVKPVNQKVATPNKPEFVKKLGSPPSVKNNQSGPVVFKPLGSNQSTPVVTSSQPHVLSPKACKVSVSHNVNIIPPSMIRSNLKQTEKTIQGSNFQAQNPKDSQSAILSPKRSKTASGDSVSSPVAAHVLKQMGNNATEAILID